MRLDDRLEEMDRVIDFEQVNGPVPSKELPHVALALLDAVRAALDVDMPAKYRERLRTVVEATIEER